MFFVVVGLICELYAATCIFVWKHSTFLWKHLRLIIVILFLLDVAFSVAKLFPGVVYNCASWSCRKVTHVCTMTLCAFLFQLVEVYILRTMTRDQGTRVPILFKVVKYAASLAFVLYDASTQDPPGVGTTVLVVLASLAEILLLAIEAHTFWTYRRPEATVSPLIAQVQLGEYENVQRLLQDGADANAANVAGERALPFAVEQGRLDLVKLLLDFKADPNTIFYTRNSQIYSGKIDSHMNPCTALHWAAGFGNLPVVHELVSAGADVNMCVREQYGYRYGSRTALHAAARHGHLPVVQALVSAGADINAKDVHSLCMISKTALHFAAENGHLPVVQGLVSLGADVNANDERFYTGTPLRWAKFCAERRTKNLNPEEKEKCREVEALLLQLGAKE